MRVYKYDSNGYDKSIDVYKNDKLVSGVYYDLNDDTDCIGLVHELNRLNNMIVSLREDNRRFSGKD